MRDIHAFPDSPWKGNTQMSARSRDKIRVADTIDHVTLLGSRCRGCIDSARATVRPSCSRRQRQERGTARQLLTRCSTDFSFPIDSTVSTAPWTVPACLICAMRYKADGRREGGFERGIPVHKVSALALPCRYSCAGDDLAMPSAQQFGTRNRLHQ